MSGLYATQKDDYPITVRTGHSIAEVILSPEHIHYTGIDTPDIVLLLSVDGLNQIIRRVPEYPATTRIYAEESLVPLLKTQAQIISLPLKTAAKEVGKLAIGPLGFGAILAREQLYPLRGLRGCRHAAAEERRGAGQHRRVEGGDGALARWNDTPGPRGPTSRSSHEPPGAPSQAPRGLLAVSGHAVRNSVAWV